MSTPRPPMISPPAPPQIIHVAAKPGGISRAVGFVFTLLLFTIVFFLGVGVGVTAMTAAGREETLRPWTYRDGGTARIAIIPIEGVIDERRARFVHAAVKHVMNDPKIRAVVLRVDSPGGGVNASDRIWQEIDRLKKSRPTGGVPVIASFGAIAASGGYYVACGADAILAEETSMTGSIGVMAQVLTFEEALGKIGVDPITMVATNSPEKDVANDQYRQWDDHDTAQIQVMLDAAYELFNQRVRAGRGHVIEDTDRIDALADGSVFTAPVALDNGLIDGLGQLDDAIAMAEQKAGIPAGRATVQVIDSPYASLADILSLRSRAPAGSASALDPETIRRFVNELSAPRLMYLMH